MGLNLNPWGFGHVFYGTTYNSYFTLHSSCFLKMGVFSILDKDVAR